VSPTRNEALTKIVATLGPASRDMGMLTQLIDAGVDVFRINCSHASHADVATQVARVRRATAMKSRPIAILLDLQGPKIRTSKMKEPLQLAAGDLLTVIMDDSIVGEGHRCGTTYPEMAQDVSAGDHVLFADGALSGFVYEVRRDIEPAEVDIRMDVGGELGSHKGMNLPGVNMSVPSVTDKDIADALLGLQLGVDYIALSFVRRAQDILDLHAHFEKAGASAPVIAKIEKSEALERLGRRVERERLENISIKLGIVGGCFGIDQGSFVPQQVQPGGQSFFIGDQPFPLNLCRHR